MIATDVKIENREVAQWTQPMVEPAQEGLCAFVGKEIDGVLHLIVQCKLECGNFDVIELAPTVQCLTGNYTDSLASLPFLDYVLNAPKETRIFDTLQSEEGGRFYREQNRNLFILDNDTLPLDLPSNYLMSLNQLHKLIQYNILLNIQARTLLATLQLTE